MQSGNFALLMRRHFYCSARRWGRCPASHPFELSADNGRRLLPADRARRHALSIGHHLMPFWNCRHCSAEISTSWTWNLHLFPDRLSEARSARIGEVKNLTKDAGAAEAARSFVDLSALRRDPARFGLCRFCASCSCKSSGCEPPGN